MEQLQNTHGHSEEASAIQTSKLVTSIEDEKKHDILHVAARLVITTAYTNRIVYQQ